MRPIPVGAAVLLVCVAFSQEPGRQWPQWRGPHLDGTARGERGLPVEWGPNKNVAWRVELPSWSAATPAVWGDTLFVVSAEEGFAATGGGGMVRHAVRHLLAKLDFDDRIYLLALSAADGSELWRRQIGDGNRVHLKHNEASPSPVTDGKRVWVMTGNGVVSCFDFAGEIRWRRDLAKDYGEFGLYWGYGSSPFLDAERLYVQVLHGSRTERPSYLLALDASNGKTLWKVERPTDARGESLDAYTTPTLVQFSGKKRIVVSGAGYVTLHDPAMGRETARTAGLIPNNERNYRIVNSPVAVGRTVLAGGRRKPFVAFEISESGTLSRKWSINRGPDVPTPVSDGERVWIVDDRGVAQCLRLSDGSAIWGPKRLEPGAYSSSPTLADGKVYATSEDATTTVLEAGDDFRLLAVNKLEDHTLASFAVVGRRLYLRTARYLFALEK